ncbi:DnaB-like helicase C-terminal domain-containing protein [Candidatus Vidania fulgoroideorum]
MKLKKILINLVFEARKGIKNFTFLYKKLYKKVKYIKPIKILLKIFNDYYKKNKKFELNKIFYFSKKYNNSENLKNILENNKKIKNINNKKLINKIKKYKKKEYISKYLIKCSKHILLKKSYNKIFKKIQLKFSKLFKKKNLNSLEINKTLNKIKNNLKNKEKLVNYYKTGFNSLDNIINGFSKGDLIVIAGRPSLGKTSFCLNILENLCIKSKKPSFFCSLEMTKEQILVKIISSLSEVDLLKIKSNSFNEFERIKINKSIKKIKKSKIFINDGGNYSFCFIKKMIKKLIISNKKISIIIIDYLQLIQIYRNKENRNIEISKISMYFKKIALLYKIIILLISQLNRSLESRVDKRPIMSDLKDSGSIEQDADIIIFLYKKNTFDSNNKEINFYICKNRNGKTGFFTLIFKGNKTRFYDKT